MLLPKIEEREDEHPDEIDEVPVQPRDLDRLVGALAVIESVRHPPRGDEQTSMFGAPARSEVGAQMYNQAIDTVMISKFTQGKEKLDDVIKWAEKELEGTLRA